MNASVPTETAYAVIAAVMVATVAVYLATLLSELPMPGWLATVVTLFVTVVAAAMAFERVHRLARHHARHRATRTNTTGGTNV